MRIVRGELDGRDTPRRQRTVEALRRMGITVEPTDTIRKVMWTKFVFIAGFSGVGTLTRLEVGDYRAVPETRFQKTFEQLPLGPGTVCLNLNTS